MTEPFTPKAGMRCKQNNGEITDTLWPNSSSQFPLIALVNGALRSWRADGRSSLSAETAPLDLIAEAKPDEGAKVQCVRRSGCVTPTLCAQATFCQTEPLREAPELESEIEAILNTSDEEILAQAKAEGIDVEQVTRDSRAMFEKVLCEHYLSTIARLESELASLRAQVEALQAALEEIARPMTVGAPGFCGGNYPVNDADTMFGIARAALAKSKGAG
jgi:hypothetical protein